MVWTKETGTDRVHTMSPDTHEREILVPGFLGCRATDKRRGTPNTWSANAKIRKLEIVPAGRLSMVSSCDEVVRYQSVMPGTGD